jgi:hypothetical protein
MEYNLQLDRSPEFPIIIKAPQARAIQIGTFLLDRLISKSRREWGPICRYGYLDLCSSPNKEASWVRLQIQDPSPFAVNNERDRDPLILCVANPWHDLDLMFFVDHDLVVSVRYCTLPSPLLSARPHKVTACILSGRAYLL